MNTIKVEIFGTGCKKCQQLEANAKEAIASLNLDAEVLHITDPVEIAQRGILSTPALAVNNKILSKGQVITSDRIKSLLQG